ncbi:MAG: M23 family metallopeptidase [Candidatus Nealsonbacteria bacterium]|nr:M23 family metallopeptidase [Candidatus Nealsonbacteria bacterium]
MRSLWEELYRLFIIQGETFLPLIQLKAKEYLGALKGSCKDPFLYLGATSVILFGFLVFSVSPSLAGVSQSASFLPQLQDNFDQSQSFIAPKGRIAESPGLNFFQKNSLAAVSPLISVTPQVLGALTQGLGYEDTKRDIVEYVVEPGDNLWSVSDKFSLSLNTLLWANDLNKNSLLQPGQKLIIPPVDGVIHHVQKGDTLSSIAKTYKAQTDKILAFNDLSQEGGIFIGDILIIPGGQMPPKYVPPSSIPLASNYFISPLGSPFKITQGLHWYNAVDISSGGCGKPIFSAAAGEILRVALTNSTSRWAFNGLGNHLTILHPNGVVTYYGHLQTSVVEPGDNVSQGQLIGYVGGQPGMPGAGLSTGCHLHFGVSGARNPLAQ